MVWILWHAALMTCRTWIGLKGALRCPGWWSSSWLSWTAEHCSSGFLSSWRPSFSLLQTQSHCPSTCSQGPSCFSRGKGRDWCSWVHCKWYAKVYCPDGGDTCLLFKNIPRLLLQVLVIFFGNVRRWISQRTQSLSTSLIFHPHWPPHRR